MWQPDGWGWRARIGLIVPHADVCAESEIHAIAPDGVSIHAARVFFEAMASDPNMNEDIELEAIRGYVHSVDLDAAAETLSGAPLSVVAFAFTSTSYLGGAGDDAVVKSRLEARTRGMPVVTTCASVVLAMKVLDRRRLALIHPPWVSQSLTSLGAEWFGRQGLEVVHASSMEVTGGQHDLQLGQLYRWAREHVPREAQAVFFGGNGLRAVGVIRALEEDLDRPVLTANQVLLWHALRRAGVRAPVEGYGEILARGLST